MMFFIKKGNKQTHKLMAIHATEEEYERLTEIIFDLTLTDDEVIPKILNSFKDSEYIDYIEGILNDELHSENNCIDDLLSLVTCDSEKIFYPDRLSKADKVLLTNVDVDEYDYDTIVWLLDIIKNNDDLLYFIDDYEKLTEIVESVTFVKLIKIKSINMLKYLSNKLSSIYKD